MLGTAGSQSGMSSSQTMPQLNYTRQDIQEQYLSARQAGSANKRHRAESSDTKRRRKDDNHFDINDIENERDSSTGTGDERSSRSRTRSDGSSKKERSRSASIFSSCFHIPNISSTIANQLPQRRPKIFSHLGGGSRKQSQQQQDNKLSKQNKSATLSGSKTVSDFQSSAIESSENQWPASGQRAKALGGISGSSSMLGTPTQGRKHVSFGVGKQHDTSMVDQAQIGNENYGQSQSQQQQQPHSSANVMSFEKGNSIVRNYQAHRKIGNDSMNDMSGK